MVKGVRLLVQHEGFYRHRNALTQPLVTRISEPERMLNTATRFARVRGIALLLVDHCKKAKANADDGKSARNLLSRLTGLAEGSQLRGRS